MSTSNKPDNPADLTDKAIAAEWHHPETFYLSEIALFNWGSFNGQIHRATFDLAGTAVIGPTGSGKTTLIDALMTLLCATPRYNLASTGGHESDRDLVSYVRGVSGPGDGGADLNRTARPTKTVTAIAAHFKNKEPGNEQHICLAALLWFDGTSSSPSDMKKLWLFADLSQPMAAPGLTHTPIQDAARNPTAHLEYWLSLQQEGGMKALRQHIKETQGLWGFTSKKAYLARLRDYFAVGEKAFSLLNRAAGLKQLNSIDEIFRELVLNNNAAFDRAGEVADSFNDLQGIHQELDIARRQQKSLSPVAESWQLYQKQQRQYQQHDALKTLLPLWYAQQAQQLWLKRDQHLQHNLAQARQQEQGIHHQCQSLQQSIEQLRQAYLQAGGANIEQLQERISEWQNIRQQRQRYAKEYQHLCQQLALKPELNAQTLHHNQQQLAQQQAHNQNQWQAQQEAAFNLGVSMRDSANQCAQLAGELKQVQARPSSNLPPQFHHFRAALSQHLNTHLKLDLSDNDLAFVAELVQIKTDQSLWRGAIERAIGSHRLRLIVPAHVMPQALEWVNQRHNHLHVRLLSAQERPRKHFLDDGFSRKLDFKQHPLNEAAKALIANIDRHCVSDAQQLLTTEHALTPQGAMSGRRHYFDKQDQKHLSADWFTGFNNRDRLDALNTELAEAQHNHQQAQQKLQAAQALQQQLADKLTLCKSLAAIHFDTIDLTSAQNKLSTLQQQLTHLTAADSQSTRHQQALQQTQATLAQQEQAYQQAMSHSATCNSLCEQATREYQHAKKLAPNALTQEQLSQVPVQPNQAQRGETQQHFAPLTDKTLEHWQDVERNATRTLQSNIDNIRDRLETTRRQLTRRMSDAKNADRGALAEVGRELDDVPAYLERLQILTTEALPEKLTRFKHYLNRSSDEGVTQLLSHVENEVAVIEERLEDLNKTLQKVDFQKGRYLQLVSNKVIHESLRSLQQAQRELASARYHAESDDGESQYKALAKLIALLRDACDRQRTQGAKALLDPRFRLEFSVSIRERSSHQEISRFKGSQSGSGGEKEIIASYVLTASLSYALCPAGSSHPLFGTIVLDEAFSRSSQAVASRIIAALHEFGLHAIFITPNKEMRLLRNHTRSAIVVHRRGPYSMLTSMSWRALNDLHQQR